MGSLRRRGRLVGQVVIAAGAVGLLLRGSPGAQAGLVSPHRLRGGAANRRLCTICHIPARDPASDAEVPKWNRHTVELAFRPFDEPADAPSPRQLIAKNDETRRCLSCHDATIGTDIPDGRVARVLMDVVVPPRRLARAPSRNRGTTCPSAAGAAIERHVQSAIAAGPAPVGQAWRRGSGELRVPPSISKLCLSCHDGTVGPNALGASRGPLVGREGDHPVSVRYDLAARTRGALRDPATDGDGDPDTIGEDMPYLPLVHGRLECTTCHDPHDNASVGNPKLLIRSVQRSALCRTCHTE